MLLTALCQNVMRATGYTAPSTFIGNTSPDARRMVAIVNQAGVQLARQPWRRLTAEATVSVSVTSIYALPSDFSEVVNNTIWNRTDDTESYGPLTEQEWQRQKGSGITTYASPEWRLTKDKQLELLSPPSATEVWVLEYRSSNWVVDTSSSATAALWSSSTERTALDETLLELDLTWRWLRAKGMDYQTEYLEFRRLFDDEIARDKGGSKKLNLRGEVVIDTVTDVGL